LQVNKRKKIYIFKMTYYFLLIIAILLKIIYASKYNEFIKSLVLLPDGNIISSSQYASIKIWNLKNGTIVNRLLGHTDSVRY